MRPGQRPDRRADDIGGTPEVGRRQHRVAEIGSLLKDLQRRRQRQRRTAAGPGRRPCDRCAACSARASARQAASTGGAWQVVRAASAARSVAWAASAK